ncbi:MAG: glycosyltransferase family 4 protein [Candidatus Wenzhouxiangella sp. M2_3B_020]
MQSFLQIGIALLAAFAVTSVLVPASAGPARRLGLIDHPDFRKRHAHPTPLTGGLCIFAGFIASLIIIGLPFAPYWTLLLGMIFLLFVGLLDDMIEISATARLLVQIGVASLMVFGGGLEIHNLGTIFGPAYGPVGLGIFSAPFTIACVVFTINAINMTDGLDGLAGGIGVFTFALLALAAWLDGAPMSLVAVALALSLATAGFLVHNARIPGRERARAFLGDTGSMLLGYSIAWLAVTVGTRSGGDIYPISIAWLLIIPAMDTLALFFRRLHLGRSPFSPDRTHLHHIIQRCHYSISTTVHIVHLLVVATGLFGILAWVYGWPQWVMFVGAAGLLIGYQIVLANARHIMRWHHRRRRMRMAKIEG